MSLKKISLFVSLTFVCLFFSYNEQVLGQNFPGGFNQTPGAQYPMYRRDQIKRFPDTFYKVRMENGKDTSFHGFTYRSKGRITHIEYINAKGLHDSIFPNETKYIKKLHLKDTIVGYPIENTWAFTNSIGRIKLLSFSNINNDFNWDYVQKDNQPMDQYHKGIFYDYLADRGNLLEDYTQGDKIHKKGKIWMGVGLGIMAIGGIYFIVENAKDPENRRAAASANNQSNQDENEETLYANGLLIIFPGIISTVIGHHKNIKGKKMKMIAITEY